MAAKFSKKGLMIGLTIGLIAILIIIVVVLQRRKTIKSQTTTNNVNNTNTTDNSFDVLNPENLFPLKYGSRNEYVRKLQEWLKSKGQELPIYGVDGIFGTETQAALKAVTGKESIDYSTFTEITK